MRAFVKMMHVPRIAARATFKLIAGVRSVVFVASVVGAQIATAQIATAQIATALQAQARASANASTNTAANARPRLIVFLAIDQMRTDYFARFGAELHGGLGRLMRQGAFFTNAMHDHAITETAPGHASMLSGRFPVHTGIASNAAGVGDSTAPLIGSASLGASPRRFHGTTLVDWLWKADSGSRVLSISRKDRAAILPVGRGKRDVYWYTPEGNFTTSTYYRDTLPAWLTRFNAMHLPASYAGRVWTPLSEEAGTFSHPITLSNADVPAKLPTVPWMDEVTLNAALAGVRAMELGAPRGGEQHTDLLSVSLSTTDAVGHLYGPDSPEIRDQILRLDGFLGAFLDSLYVIRDSSSIVIALTADHGVGPIPGTKSLDPNDKGQYVNVAPLEERFRIGLRRAGVAGDAIELGNVVTVNRAALAAKQVNADSLIAAIRDSLRAKPGVLRADRISDLQHTDTVHDAIARRWLHMFDDDSTAALVVTLQPYCYWGLLQGGGEHGSPHDYDARVPVIFVGRAFMPGRYDGDARVVDIAPTLAAVVGVTPSEPTDGHVLSNVLHPTSVSAAPRR